MYMLELCRTKCYSDAPGRVVPPEIRLVATDGAIDVLVVCRANRTVVAILLDAQERVIKWSGALLDLKHWSEFGNGLAGPDDHDPLSSLDSRNKA